jgi:VWFA-related protein
MRRKVRTFIKLALLVLLLFAVAALAQDDQSYKIRAKIDLVVVPVTVKGSGDKLITGLTKNDFVILEDGTRQTISNFSVEPVPLSAAVVVDTGLAPDSLSKVQQTFSALAGSFSQFDEVAVYRYDKFVTKIIDFSNNDEKFATAMQTMRDLKADLNTGVGAIPSGPFSIPGPVINGAAVLPPGQANPGGVITSPPKASKVLHDAIFTAAADLSKRERSRRKMVLVISDGDTTGSDHSFDDTRNILLQFGVQVYAIGLDQPFPFKKVSILDDYAKATGGDVYFVGSVNSIERSYMTATEEARNQYIISYVSNNEISGPGPVFRDITVQVGPGNYKTLHRKGYYQYP